ncbi:MAG: putative enzyme related to lactoylglutathione lyase [Myxococcota bacterium]|jgi:predicted enzyme related to lactoylglutathione lyase
MAYTTNKFCWHGVISSDTTKAEAFYSEVIGWNVMRMPMGDSEATMFASNGVPLAHLMAPPMAEVPSHWNNYLRVVDVDASSAACAEAGGTVVVPPTDIPVGRFSVVTSPSGAMVSLFHEADEATSTNGPTTGHGAIHWVELHSKDLDADLAWLKTSLGIGHQTMPMPTGPYHILVDGETRVGGAMTSMNDKAPSMWLAWVAVDDVDACVKRVTNNGGQTFSPTMDVEGVGRMAVVADNTGGVFGVITPAPQQG